MELQRLLLRAERRFNGSGVLHHSSEDCMKAIYCEPEAVAPLLSTAVFNGLPQSTNQKLS